MHSTSLTYYQTWMLPSPYSVTYTPHNTSETLLVTYAKKRVVKGMGFQCRMFGCYSNGRYKKHCVVEHLRSSKIFIIRLVRVTLSLYTDESQWYADGTECPPFISLENTCCSISKILWHWLHPGRCPCVSYDIFIVFCIEPFPCHFFTHQPPIIFEVIYLNCFLTNPSEILYIVFHVFCLGAPASIWL